MYTCAKQCTYGTCTWTTKSHHFVPFLDLMFSMEQTGGPRLSRLHRFISGLRIDQCLSSSSKPACKNSLWMRLQSFSGWIEHLYSFIPRYLPLLVFDHSVADTVSDVMSAHWQVNRRHIGDSAPGKIFKAFVCLRLEQLLGSMQSGYWACPSWPFLFTYTWPQWKWPSRQRPGNDTGSA